MIIVMKNANLFEWSDKTILIVEDIDINNIFFEAALRKTQAKLIYAFNGIEAVDICKKNKDIDVILMDLQMPEMDGYEASRQIRSFRKDVPIIAQTAHLLINAEANCYKAGCNDFLTKPIRLNHLLTSISKYI